MVTFTFLKDNEKKNKEIFLLLLIFVLNNFFLFLKDQMLNIEKYIMIQRRTTNISTTEKWIVSKSFGLHIFMHTYKYIFTRMLTSYYIDLALMEHCHKSFPNSLIMFLFFHVIMCNYYYDAFLRFWYICQITFKEGCVYKTYMIGWSSWKSSSVSDTHTFIVLVIFVQWCSFPKYHYWKFVRFIVIFYSENVCSLFPL